MFLPNKHRPRQWTVFRTRAMAAGMRVVQDGDSEGCLAFTPDEPGQAELAVKIAGVKRRRKVSEARRQQLCEHLGKRRTLLSSAPVGGELSP